MISSETDSEVVALEEGIWVFGYGSLCWYPGFEYKKSALGCVTGFKRRFWQGNATHRGTFVKPGRVATVVEDKEGVVWGRAFLVTGDAALPYLNQRECKLGGYDTIQTTFYPYYSKSGSQPGRRSCGLSKKSLSPSVSTESSLNTISNDSSGNDSFALNLLARLRLEEENSKTRESLTALNNLTTTSLAKFFNSDSGYSSPNDEEIEEKTKKPFLVLMYVATEENCHWLGINKEILEQLKNSIEVKKLEDRYCCLIFDEMSVKPLLTYSKDNDEIIGFTDHGAKGCSSVVAKEALVFMIRSVNGDWKQPVSILLKSWKPLSADIG